MDGMSVTKKVQKVEKVCYHNPMDIKNFTGKIVALSIVLVLLSACSQNPPAPLETSESTTTAESFSVLEDDHIQSLWTGSTVALVEHCTSGFHSPNPEKFPNWKLCDDDPGSKGAYLDFQLQDGTYSEMGMQVSEKYYWDITSPGGSSLEYTFTSDEKYWIYMDTWTGEETKYMAHNIQTGEDELLISLLPPAGEPYDSCTGQGFIDWYSKGWNPSKTKLGIIASNEGSDSYPELTKIFILTLKDGNVVAKNKYDIPVGINCSPNNGPAYYIGWLDDDTLQYFDKEKEPEYGDFDQIYKENGWDAEYTKQLDVK